MRTNLRLQAPGLAVVAAARGGPRLSPEQDRALRQAEALPFDVGAIYRELAQRAAEARAAAEAEIGTGEQPISDRGVTAPPTLDGLASLYYAGGLR
ncbi:MAG TPA: hypothetical protein VMX54_21405 [Vicinamibacteria bacterium]|nr:hypothetical protein [Vicinamibacteria bacterium]